MKRHGIVDSFSLRRLASHLCLACAPILGIGCAQAVPSLTEHGSLITPVIARAAAPEVLPDQAKPPAEQHAPAVLPIGLDTVLRLAEEQNGQIGLARERVNEAFAEKELARTAWLPAINVGPAYYRHEGGVQDEDGHLTRSSTGALFAGMELNGKIDLREATFRKVNAERQVWQKKGELSRVTTDILLDASTTYIDLLTARTGESIARQLQKYDEELLDEARKLVKGGLGSQVQVESLQAELFGLRQSASRLQSQGNSASAKLAYLIGVDPETQLVPVDAKLVPLELIDPATPLHDLLTRAQTNGPGIKELERLLAVINEGREKASGHARLLPVLEMRVLEGAFGAGPGSSSSWDNRFDLGLQARWNLSDLVTGSKAARVADSQIQQAHLTYQDVRAKLSMGVQEARDSSLAGTDEVRMATQSVEHANEGYELSKKRFKNNDPGGTMAEVAQFVRGLQVAYLAYLTSVSNYDKAQLRLLVLTGGVGNAPECKHGN
jgi:outer membrane protein TolC